MTKPLGESGMPLRLSSLVPYIQPKVVYMPYAAGTAIANGVKSIMYKITTDMKNHRVSNNELTLKNLD